MSEVTFALKPVGEEVELTILHHRLATERERLSVSGGWDVHTSILYALLAGSTQPPFWTAFSMIEAEYKKRLPKSA